MAGSKNIQAGIQITADVAGTGEITRLAQEIEAAGVETHGLGNEAKALGQAFADLNGKTQLLKEFRDTKTRSQELAGAMAEAESRVKSLARSMGSQPTKKMQKEFQAAVEEARRLKKAHADIQVQLHGMRQKMGDAGIGTRNLAAAERELRLAAEQAKDKLSALQAEAQRLKKTADARMRLGLDVDAKSREQIKQLTADYQMLRRSGTLTKQELARATELYTAKLKQLRTEAQAVPSSINPISEALGGIGKQGLAIAGVGGGLFAVKEVVQAILEKTQEFQGIRQKLDYAFGGTAEGAKQLAFVSDVANRLGLEVAGAAEGYAQLSAATKNLNISHQQTQQIFQGVASATAAMHLSAEDAKGVFLALSQIAGKGKVSMEELRGQLGERLAPAMSIAAQSMGVTSAELEKMVENGISAEEFLPKFGAALEQSFGNEAAANVNTLSGQINVLKNSFDQLLVDLGDSGVADAAIKVLQDVGGMMDWVKEQIDNLDASISGGVRDAFVSFYELLKEAGGTVADAFSTVYETLSDIGRAISAVVGGSEQDFDLLRGIIDGLNVTIGVLRDGFEGVGAAVDVLAGATLDAIALMAKGMAKITWGDLAKGYEKAAADLEAAADRHWNNLEKRAQKFHSHAVEAAQNAGKDSTAALEKQEQDARAAYQRAAQAAIDAAEKAKSAQQQAHAAIGTAAEESAKKQADEANKAADTARMAAQKAEKDWRNAFVKIGGDSEEMAKITEPMRAAGLAASDAAESVKKIPAALADAKGAAQAFGLDVRAAMDTASPNMQTMSGNIDKIGRGFDEMKKAGIDASMLLRQAMDNMVSSANSRADIDLVKQKFNELGREGKLAMSDVQRGIIDADLRLQELRGTIDPVNKAFKKLGIETKEALGLSARDLMSSFETAKQSGKATADGLKSAFKTAADAALASGDAQAKAWVKANAARYGYQLAVDENGKSTLNLAQTAEKAGAVQENAARRATGALKEQTQAVRELARETDKDEKSSTQKTHSDAADTADKTARASQKTAAAARSTAASASEAGNAARASADAARDAAAANAQARSARMGLEAELARTQGNNDAADELEQKQKIAEIQKQITEAQQAGDAQSASEYLRALSLQRQIFAAKKQQAAADRAAEEERKKQEEQQKQETPQPETPPAPQPSDDAPVVRADMPSPSSDTVSGYAQQIADGLSEALTERDKRLIEKVLQELMTRLRDEFKRMN